MACARFCGPIAALYNKYEAKQFTLPEKYDKSILIFTSKGEIKKVIPFDLKERIICFEFTADEFLLIVYATGQYFLIDPHSGNLK